MPYIGKEPVAGNFVLLDSITTSATATYALTKDSVAYSPESARNMIVSLNGVTQAPETAFTVSGSNITFSSALTASDVIDYILVLGDVLSVGTPSDGTVGTSQMSYPLGNFSSTGIDDNATSTAITIDSSENVGIGTTSPSTALHVSSATTTKSVVETSGTSSDALIEFTRGQGSGNSWSIGLDQSASSALSFAYLANGSPSLTTHSKMVIDSSGNVGIGTTSPTAPLSVAGNITVNSAIYRTDTGAGGIRFATAGNIRPVNNAGTSTDLALDIGDPSFRFNNLYLGGTTYISNATTSAFFQTSTNILQFGTSSTSPLAIYTNNTERMRIDNSGNLLVGHTANNTYNTTAGSEIWGNGFTSHTKDGGICLILNRLTSDGDIAVFRKDGSTVGSIGATSSDLYIQGPTNHAGLRFDTAALLPLRNGTITGADNLLDIGAASYRFDDIYATNATIQTSDANEKQDIEALSEAETRVAVAAKALLRKFRWKSAVEEKGDEARIHFGIIAQDLKAAFEAEGLDAGRYAMFIHSTWTDEETGEERSRMGVRYSELLAFIIAAI